MTMKELMKMIVKMMHDHGFTKEEIKDFLYDSFTEGDGNEEETPGIRNYQEYERGPYLICEYEDFFCGEWMGNQEVYCNGKEMYHSTITHLHKPEELPDELDGWLELDKFIKDQ